jgi:hypothetical protein
MDVNPLQVACGTSFVQLVQRCYGTRITARLHGGQQCRRCMEQAKLAACAGAVSICCSGRCCAICHWLDSEIHWPRCLGAGSWHCRNERSNEGLGLAALRLLERAAERACLFLEVVSQPLSNQSRKWAILLNGRKLDVRFGSDSEVTSSPRHFRFPLGSGPFPCPGDVGSVPLADMTRRVGGVIASRLSPSTIRVGRQENSIGP